MILELTDVRTFTLMPKELVTSEDAPENCEVFAGELREITFRKKTLLFVISRF